MSTRTPRCRQVRPKAAAPKRHRSERAPSGGDDMFPWACGERVEGVRRKPKGDGFMARLEALYGPKRDEASE
jgi:hypothetical protein